jgi:ATP-dependent DNA helicase Rep
MFEGKDEALPDAVRLSTIHAAKGLEFPHVYLVGMEEGVLPHREAIAHGNIDEERRLMYVAITRAQDTVELTWCRRRKRGGELQESVPSRFIGELAQEDLRHAELPLAPEDAAREKEAGNARLKSLRAMLAR